MSQNEEAAMARRWVKVETLRALFARSGNVCAFPACDHPLIQDETTFVGEVCHIEAAMPGGERFNPQQTEDERRSFENLLLLCHRHHVVTDDAERYTVGVLREMKASHAEAHSGRRFKVEERALERITKDIERYWEMVDRAHRFEHIAEELRIPIEAGADFSKVVANARATLEGVSDAFAGVARDRLSEDATNFLRGLGYDTSAIEAAPYHTNPFVNRHWETTSLILPNLVLKLELCLDQLELLYVTEQLKVVPGDMKAQERQAALKQAVLVWATRGGFAV
jgi:hypothetical protein